METSHSIISQLEIKTKLIPPEIEFLEIIFISHLIVLLNAPLSGKVTVKYISVTET